MGLCRVSNRGPDGPALNRWIFLVHGVFVQARASRAQPFPAAGDHAPHRHEQRRGEQAKDDARPGRTKPRTAVQMSGTTGKVTLQDQFGHAGCDR